jgi:hypothetical protein
MIFDYGLFIDYNEESIFYLFLVKFLWGDKLRSELSIYVIFLKCDLFL